MDGDVAPLVEIVELAEPLRRARDGRRGARDRRARPGRPRQRRRRGARGRGRRDRRHARQGARRLRRLRLLRRRDGELSRQHRAHADLLDRAAPALRRGRAGRARAAARAAAPGRAPAAQRAACCATRSPRRASPCPDGETQIVPLVVGEPELALDVCERALGRGVFAQAIRPPTVPAGSSRLRLAAMATHTPAELALGRAAARRGGARGGRRARRDSAGAPPSCSCTTPSSTSRPSSAPA